MKTKPIVLQPDDSHDYLTLCPACGLVQRLEDTDKMGADDYYVFCWRCSHEFNPFAHKQDQMELFA